MYKYYITICDRLIDIFNILINAGPVIGSGAFGIVLRAQMCAPVKNTVKRNVAVKTLKMGCNKKQLKLLIMELKIMTYLGEHLNIVSLIGACTENLVKRSKKTIKIHSN